jgi:hypothetical protein
VTIIDFGNHPFARTLIEATHWVGIQPVGVSWRRQQLGLILDLSYCHRVCDQMYPQPSQHGFRNCAEGYPGGCLPCASAFQDRTSIPKSILLHTSEIGVSWTRSGECGGTSPCQLFCSDRGWAHYSFPLWPFGIFNSNHDWPALGNSVAHTGGYLNAVSLELLARSPAVTESSASKWIRDVLGQQL